MGCQKKRVPAGAEIGVPIGSFTKTQNHNCLRKPTKNKDAGAGRMRGAKKRGSLRRAKLAYSSVALQKT